MPRESPTSKRSAIGSSVRAIAALYAVKATIGSPPLRRANSAGVRFLLSGAATLISTPQGPQLHHYTAVQHNWALAFRRGPKGPEMPDRQAIYGHAGLVIGPEGL